MPATSDFPGSSGSGFSFGGYSGGGVTGYDPRFGGIPTVPDPGQSASSAIGANMQNLSALYSLYGGLNTFGAEQAANQLKLNMPNYQGLIDQRSNVIGQELRGQLPQDVVNQLIQGAAERGITNGIPNSPNSNAAYLRALGTNSLAMMNAGQQHLSQGIHDTPTAPLQNPAQMFITPDAVQQARMMANIYASAPNPRAAAEWAMRNSGGGGGGGGIGGFNSNSRPVSLPGGGGGSPYHNPEPDYSNNPVAYGPGGGPMNFSIPGVPMTYQFGSGSQASSAYYNNTFQPGGAGDFWGHEPGGSYDDSGWDSWWNNASNFGGDDSGWDEWWNDANNFEPNSYYNPVVDVSSGGPTMLPGGGYSPLGDVDFGF